MNTGIKILKCNILPAITALRKEKGTCWSRIASYRRQTGKPWVQWKTLPQWVRWRVVKKDCTCQTWSSTCTDTPGDLYCSHISPHTDLSMHTHMHIHHAHIYIRKKYLNGFSIFFILRGFWLLHFCWIHWKICILLPLLTFCTTSRSILEIIKWIHVLLFCKIYLFSLKYYVSEDALDDLWRVSDFLELGLPESVRCQIRMLKI